MNGVESWVGHPKFHLRVSNAGGELKNETWGAHTVVYDEESKPHREAKLELGL
jgi:hypothetical protein